MSAHEYVKYIQFTLDAFGSYKKPIDGIYGAQTARAVNAFQVSYGERYIDGKIDSETKWNLALFWKNKNDFDNWIIWARDVKKVPEVIPYMQAARNTVLASEIGNKTYRKITFTGFGGPSEARDILFFEVPVSTLKTVDSITIEADDNPLWRNFSIDMYGWSSNYTTNVFQTNINAINASALNNNIQINLGGMNASDCRYMWISVVGKTVAYYGSGEGFGIKSIKADGLSIIEDAPGADPVNEITIPARETTVTATIESTESHTNINSSEGVTKNYTTSNLTRSTSFIKTITYSDPENFEGSKTINITLPLNDNTLHTIDNNLQINFGAAPNSVTFNSATLGSITSNGVEITGDPIELTNTANGYSLSTSAVYYSGSQVFNISNSLNTGYKLRTVDGRIFNDSRNSIDVNDGILLLCKSDGSPFGLPTSTEINTELSGISSITDEEIDLRYGSFIVSNQIENQDGLIYGYYDISEKEFLGKNISYIDFVARGVSNIYIGLCAIDADGNTQNKNEYIGPSVDMTFKPVNVPLKSIVPIYSVKINSSSAIKIGKFNQNAGKFDIWQLPITTGSFWKKINISNNKQWTDWKLNYINQELTAEYTTVNELDSIASEFFGSGYYDILDETPLILSTKKIQINNTPILAWNYPTNNENSIVGIIKPQIKIYTRETVSSEWVEIPYGSIRDIDCYNGTIEMDENVVPQDPSLIKVSYTTVNKDVLIKHINGTPLPLNPVLNSSEISYNQPMFIYVLPKNIYKKENIENNTNNLIKINDYSYTTSINFTYDSSIFDSRSSNFDPFALVIATIYIFNNPYNSIPEVIDLRLRGGGVVVDKPNYELIETIPEVLSFWDVYSPSGKAYNKGGYVIIRIPEEVKDYFVDQKEIYNIISNNLTAGIAYELQDMDGNSWN